MSLQEGVNTITTKTLGDAGLLFRTTLPVHCPESEYDIHKKITMASARPVKDIHHLTLIGKYTGLQF